MFSLTNRNQVRVPAEQVRNSVIDRFNHIFETEFNDFFKDGGWIVTDSKKYSYPKMDIYEDPSKTVIEAAIPGMSNENVEVLFIDGTLTIRANSKREENRDSNNYKIKELHKSSFSRSINVPEDVYDVDNIEAKVENGMLTVSVPKKVTVPKPDNFKKIKVH